MIIQPIKTKKLMPPRDDLLAAIQAAVPALPDQSILAITSKVVSIWQGRCLAKAQFPDKDALIIQEADKYLPRELVPQGRVMLTIKNNLLVPTAGIDEISDYYILWPDQPAKTAKQIYDWVRATYKIKEFGLLITDSHSVPLRRGTLGLALAYYGFSPIKDYRGTLGLYGRTLQVTQANIADGLAAAAVAAMGEGAESTPLALITDLAEIQFFDQQIISDKSRTLRRGIKPYHKNLLDNHSSQPQMARSSDKVRDKPFSTFSVNIKEDLYYPLLTALPWKKGGGGLEKSK